MGELGLKASETVHLHDGTTGTLKQLIEHSLKNFQISQELEFTVIAYSRWLPPTNDWVDRYGDSHSFDELVTVLLERPAARAACYGIHMPYALISVLRVDERNPIINPQTSKRARERLIEISALLERNQDSTGLWLGRWYESNSLTTDSTKEFQGILSTGHHLEWIALAPPDLRPRRSVIERAARALTEVLRVQRIETVSNNYAPFSHACHALVLLQGATTAPRLAVQRPGQ